ncbi:MAG: alpha/beta hydrolase [Alphaproteobacteria bacterium]|nr:MAG: alpha/beta hydrolase [Alphaproteobacteria bacterium]
MTTFTTTDGTEIFYKDWGTGQPIVFSHGWPLSGDAWEDQMNTLASQGYRVIAHDRRGHGKSAQTWLGNDMDTYADDLAQLLTQLNVTNAILVGHSTGGGEITRYVGRHGTARVAGMVLIGAVTPGMLQTASNPGGVPMSVFDDIRANTARDRSQYFKDFATPFFGKNRPGSTVTQGMLDTFWLIGMQGSLKSQLDCIAAFSESDFTADLKKVNVPLLILHGDDDQIVPIDNTARRAQQLVPGSQLKVYAGGSHALPATHKAEISADIAAFAASVSTSLLQKAS